MARGYLNPAHLPEGTRVGPWRLRERLGRGVYGAVYAAEGVAPEEAGVVALKVALFPEDKRFAREVGLLSRLRHPCIPRLLGRGYWRSPAGEYHPCFAMELLEGLPLYEWALVHPLTSRQVLRLFAGLARALEAIHAAGGVHRDIKGSNILVRLKDGRGFLTDFGSAHYIGAAPLTEEPFPPGTPAYRSPEAFRYKRHLLEAQGPLIPYAPQPADDLFALGITAWRLVTSWYPPLPDPEDAKAHLWDLEKGTGPRPAHELNARCCPELSSLISRMLSIHPEARGSARELAEALEQAEQKAGPEADAPLFLGMASPLGGGQAPRSAPRASWRPRLAVASLAGALALGVTCMLGTRTWQEQAAERAEEPDAGTAAIGDSTLTAPVASPHAASGWSAIGLDVPSKPLPGQTRPDATGRCARPPQVAINGGCWLKLDVELKDCLGNGYAYKGKCYTPVISAQPLPTSSPTESRDGG